MWKRPMYDLSFVTALLMLSGTAGFTAKAKGPQPQSDIVVAAKINPVEWQPGVQVGTFSASGLIEDSGNVYYVDGIVEPDGTVLDIYEFVGAWGSFQTTLPIFPNPHESYPCELLGADGDYVDLYAAGAAEGRTREQCHWVRDDPIYRGRECTYTTSWTINAFVP